MSARPKPLLAIPLAFRTEVRDGCPSDCGLCPEHKQHACLGIIEVNTGCSLDCPICFADCGHHSGGYSLSHEQCERMLDAFVESEGEAEVVMFSGGEPTIHEHILPARWRSTPRCWPPPDCAPSAPSATTGPCCA
ncbi:radical SAM protein [Streptomyces sp. TRM70350]|uniref:radical SAM protein n=1 Tax=Streptomyces sp. TRM70350 TaxID=2856165 RepID=UPI00210F5A53|nr:radical SAM protein [Streptomyces sp. TRM70350]